MREPFGFSTTKDGVRFVEKPPATALGFKDYGPNVPDRLAGEPTEATHFDHCQLLGWPDMSDEEVWDE